MAVTRCARWRWRAAYGPKATDDDVYDDKHQDQDEGDGDDNQQNQDEGDDENGPLPTPGWRGDELRRGPAGKEANRVTIPHSRTLEVQLRRADQAVTEGKLEEAVRGYMGLLEVDRDPRDGLVDVVAVPGAPEVGRCGYRLVSGRPQHHVKRAVHDRFELLARHAGAGTDGDGVDGGGGELRQHRGIGVSR